MKSFVTSTRALAQVFLATLALFDFFGVLRQLAPDHPAFGSKR